MTRRRDPPAVSARAADLHAQARVAYWIVLSLQDGFDLLAGRVPPAVQQQALVVKRDPTETADAYAARLRDILEPS
jgi:hypothetical protein